MVSNKKTSAIFTNSSIKVAQKFSFNGLDLDWEFLANKVDMSNLALLFKERQKALVNEAKSSGKPHLLLTSAVYYASKFMVSGEPRSYPNNALCKFVDWVISMCFDFHGSWNNVTGLHSALYDPKRNVSTSYGIRSWIQAGVSPQKLVMGLPLYGRTWKLLDPSINGIGAPTVGVGSRNGTMAYFEILEFDNKTSATV